MNIQTSFPPLRPEGPAAPGTHPPQGRPADPAPGPPRVPMRSTETRLLHRYDATKVGKLSDIVKIVTLIFSKKCVFHVFVSFLSTSDDPEARKRPRTAPHAPVPERRKAAHGPSGRQASAPKLSGRGRRPSARQDARAPNSESTARPARTHPHRPVRYAAAHGSARRDTENSLRRLFFPPIFSIFDLP